MINIYTDGACSGNPGIGGWGVVILDNNKEILLVPFCGHRVVESLAGIESDLVDPFLPKFLEQQPDAAQVAQQCAAIDTMAARLGL